MRPFLASAIGAPIVFTAQNTESKLIAITRRHSSLSVLNVLDIFALITPCARIKISGAPKLATISSKHFFAAARSAKSTARNSQFKSAATRANAAPSLATKTKSCPNALNAFAHSKPSPRDPPVITASAIVRTSTFALIVEVKLSTLCALQLQPDPSL